jgi:hypothetical protein
MRYERLLLPLLPFSLVLGALSVISAACGGGTTTSSSGAGGGGAAGDCFDYSSFDAGAKVSFPNDVVPIFQNSCALSIACHTCDTSTNPQCTNSTYKPFLGIPMGMVPSMNQLAAIISSTVGQAADLQLSTVDQSTMVGNPDMKIITAGDPGQSFMMYKLDGAFPMTPTNNEVTCMTLTCAKSSTCGQAMPSAGMPLADRDVIRRWIAQGASAN